MLVDDLHPQARFWLDVADKLIKLLAVLVGAAWTWMHYHRSRTYAQKLELQLTIRTFRRNGLYIEINASIKNLGASRHIVQREGTTCEVSAIGHDLSQQRLQILSIFEDGAWIEPGESISELLMLKIDGNDTDILCIRVDMQVSRKKLQWKKSHSVRVDDERSSGNLP